MLRKEVFLGPFSLFEGEKWDLQKHRKKIVFASVVITPNVANIVFQTSD